MSEWPLVCLWSNMSVSRTLEGLNQPVAQKLCWHYNFPHESTQTQQVPNTLTPRLLLFLGSSPTRTTVGQEKHKSDKHPGSVRAPGSPSSSSLQLGPNQPSLLCASPASV